MSVSAIRGISILNIADESSPHMETKFAIRPANPSDREDVLKLCEHSFDWGDYVPDVWDEWIRDRQSRIFAATLDNRPVAIMRVSLPKPSEAWLQAARTHPAHRRMGIATALALACLEWARSNGARVARLSTDSDNYIAQKALEKMNFVRVSDFLTMKCGKLQAEDSIECRWGAISDANRIWKFLKESDVFKASGGLYTVLFVWKTLEKKDLKRFVTSGKAIVHTSEKDVDGLILIDDGVRTRWEEDPVQTCYIDGDRRAISKMLRFLKSQSHVEGFRRIYAFACNLPLVSEALTAAGFASDDQNTEFIYEKPLIPSRNERRVI